MTRDEFNEFQSEKKTISWERASLGDRFFARFVDSIMISIMIRFLIMVPFIFILFIQKDLYGLIITLFIELAALIGYFVIYPYKHNGQTLGKKWCKLKVVALDGSNLPWWRLLIREFFSIIMVLIGANFIGVLAYLWFLTYLLALTKEKRALHDIIAGTQVVKNIMLPKDEIEIDSHQQ